MPELDYFEKIAGGNLKDQRTYEERLVCGPNGCRTHIQEVPTKIGDWTLMPEKVAVYHCGENKETCFKLTNASTGQEVVIIDGKITNDSAGWAHLTMVVRRIAITDWMMLYLIGTMEMQSMIRLGLMIVAFNGIDLMLENSQILIEDPEVFFSSSEELKLTRKAATLVCQLGFERKRWIIGIDCGVAIDGEKYQEDHNEGWTSKIALMGREQRINFLNNRATRFDVFNNNQSAVLGIKETDFVFDAFVVRTKDISFLD